MKRLFNIMMAGAIIAASCITPLQATDETSNFLPESNLTQKCMAIGTLGALAGYGYAISEYGAAKVNALAAATLTALSGLVFSTALVETGGLQLFTDTLQAPLLSVGDHSITAFALISAVGLGALVYTTVYDYLDTGKTITTKSIISMKRS